MNTNQMSPAPPAALNNSGCVVTNSNYRQYRLSNLTSKVRVAGLTQLTLITARGQRPYWLLELPWLQSGQSINLGEVTQLQPDAAKALAKRLLKGPKKSPEDGLTFGKLAWLHKKVHAVHLAPSSQASIGSYSRRLAAAFGNEPVTWITGAMVRRWHSEYSQQSPGAADEAKKLLRTLINFAKRRDLIPSDHPNPCAGIRRNRRGPGNRSFNPDELELLGAELDRDEASARYRTHARRIKLMLFTGGRPGEIRTLRWDHVIFDAGLPSHLQIPRSKAGPRRIELSSPARDILLAQHFTTKVRSDSAVFPDANNNGRCYSEEQAKNYWGRLSKRAGLEKNTRQYWLRHTFGTNSILAGGTLATAGALLGHRKPSTTQHYLHIPPEHVVEAGTRISNRIAEWMGLPIERSTSVRPVGDTARIRTLFSTAARAERHAQAKAESEARFQRMNALTQAENYTTEAPARIPACYITGGILG